MVDEWTQKEWASYVDLSYLPPQYLGEVIAAYDELWANPPERQIIMDGFTANRNTPIIINFGRVKDKRDKKGYFSVGGRENNTVGKAEIAFDFEFYKKICIKSGEQELHVPLSAWFSHEHYHIAYETRDIAYDMIPSVNRIIENRGGLTEADFAELGKLGVAPECLALYRLQNEYRQPLDLSRLTSEQFGQFVEHLLKPQSDIMRKVLNNVNIDKLFIGYLAGVNGKSRLGDITMQEAEMLMNQVNDDKRLTLDDVERQIGRKIPTAHLVDELPIYIIAGSTKLSEEERTQLRQAMSILYPYAADWGRAQSRQEQEDVETMDKVNSFHRNHPRESYDNAVRCDPPAALPTPSGAARPPGIRR